MKKWMALFFSSTFFTGFLPEKITGKTGYGGGFAGSIVALIIQTLFILNNISFVWMAWLITALFLIGIIAIGPAERFMSERWKCKAKNKNGKPEDFNQTNIDEVIGQLIAGFPVLLISKSLFISFSLLLLSFMLFRFLDVLKPWPIQQLEEKIKGPLGIILDDIAAGMIAGLIICFLLF